MTAPGEPQREGEPNEPPAAAARGYCRSSSPALSRIAESAARPMSALADMNAAIAVDIRNVSNRYRATIGAGPPAVIDASWYPSDSAAPDALVQLADRLGLPVVETWPTHLNFPRDHPLHRGFDAAALVGELDVVLAIESDVP